GENALTAAWLALAEEDPGAGLVALDALTALGGDVEVAIARTALLLRAGRRDEARAALVPVAAEPAARLVQVQMDDRDAADFDFARATPGTAIECFVLGLLAYDQVHLHKKDRSLFGVASRWLGTAVAMAQEPRASFLFWWMVTAARAGDVAAFAAALAAYERHFPHSRGLQLAYVLCASSVPVDRGLAVLGTVDVAAFPRAHLALALLYNRAGRLQESERAYRAGLAAEPRNLSAWLQLAFMLEQQQRYAEAADAARAATAIDPHSAEAWSRLGTSLVQADRPAEARAALERAIAEGPGGWRPQFNLGLLLRDAGEHEAALAAFLRAAELAPTQPEPRAFAARVLRQLGRPQEALVEDVRALQCKPSDWRQWSVVAGNLAATGLHGAAAAHAQRAVELAPEQAPAWARLAEVLLDAPAVDGPRALAAARRGDELGKGRDARTTWLLARAEAVTGDAASAVRRLEGLLAGQDVPAAVRKLADEELGRLRAPK
ncbi:MAG: tetratricopeptide repeat protein, partial [Planctomycetes bacterium]|nr:tetratricopeptide repeat protein [Planctomycetota bacterium]